MSGNASAAGLTFSQFGEGNLWHLLHSIRCAFSECENSEYLLAADERTAFFVGVAAGAAGTVALPAVAGLNSGVRPNEIAQPMRAMTMIKPIFLGSDLIFTKAA